MAIFEHQELLSDGIARLVGTLVRDQSLAMKTIGLPNVRLTAWGDARIEGLSAALSLDDGFLRIEVSGSAEHKDEIFRTCSGTTKHQELHADAEGELILRATDSNWWSSTDTHGFQAWRWSLVPPNAPSLWFGRLHGLQHGSFLPWHNLQRTKPQSIRELYLAQEEGYDYAIIRLSGDNPPYDFLLVDTKGAGAPEPETLLSDLRVLEFFHARHLKLDALQGVSKNGDTVAFAGVFTGIYQGAVGLYADFPLPAGGQCWIAPGFSNLAPLVRNPPRSTPVVRLAMRYFLSSFDGSPHEAYLKLTVALEGLALEVIADRGVHEAVVSDHDGKRWIVRDPLQWRALVRRLTSSTQYEEWRKFVKSHELEIKEQVLREEWSESLLKSFDLKHDAGRLPRVSRPACEERRDPCHPRVPSLQRLAAAWLNARTPSMDDRWAGAARAG